MDIQTFKEQMERLDPKTHKALKDALMVRYENLTSEKARIKSCKEQVSDPFAEMFEKAVDELNHRYIEGGIDYIRKSHPELYRKTNNAEERLNTVWKAGLQGKADIEEFRKILKEWYLLHLRGIEIYSQKQEGRVKSVFNKTRDWRTEE